MIMIAVLISVVAVVILMLVGIPFSANYLGWKLSGIWANQSDTLQIMIHEENDCLHGHVVSAQLREQNDKIVIGKMVIDRVKLKAVWNWSSGKYIDPYTMEEFELKVKLKGSNKLKVYFLENKNLVKKEEWKLLNSF